MFCSPSAQDVCLTLRGSNSSYSMSRLAPTFTYIPVQYLWPQGLHRRWYPCSHLVGWARIQCICPWDLFLKLGFHRWARIQCMPAGPVPQAGVQQQETVPTPPWRADTNASFLAATSAPVAAAHGVGQGATPADAAAAELPKSDDKSWWWDGKRYPPLVSRFWCQTRQRIRQVQCVQEDMLRLQDFHVEDRIGETLQRPTVFQERWQRHWCWEGLNAKYEQTAKMRTAKSMIINHYSNLWTPEYDHLYYIHICRLRWGKWLRHSMHILHIRFVVQDCSHSRSDWFVCRRSTGWAMMKRPH